MTQTVLTSRDLALQDLSPETLKSTDTETQCFSVCIWRKRCDCAAADPGFLGQGTSNLNVGTITYYFGQFFSKTEGK